MSRFYVQDFDSRVVDGINIEPRSLTEVIAFMASGTSSEDRNKIFWPQFLDFYCYLSLGIDDHDIFEFFLRNSWCIDKPTTGTVTNMARSPDSPVRMMMNSNVGFGSSNSSLGSPSTTPTAAKKGPGHPFRRGMVVTHSDGREEVVEMIDELGKTQIDAQSIISFITSKGVQDVSDIRI